MFDNKNQSNNTIHGLSLNLFNFDNQSQSNMLWFKFIFGLKFFKPV